VGLGEDIKSDVVQIFRGQWSKKDGRSVPDSPDIQLGNEAVILEGTVLYADLSRSTQLVDSYKPHFAAEVYKAYLHGAAKIIRSEAGEITAYDGDRVMAVFIGDSKNTSAARCALKINYLVQEIINPALKDAYPKAEYAVQQIVGIDSSSLFIARTGIRGANDLVWVGRAANYAAKLCNLPPEYPSCITAAVYDNLHESLKFSEGKPMWEQHTWAGMGNIIIHRSRWWWKV
jgi:class 3 adenylate cyclase